LLLVCVFVCFAVAETLHSQVSCKPINSQSDCRQGSQLRALHKLFKDDHFLQHLHLVMPRLFPA
jgi:hypothetical protein